MRRFFLVVLPAALLTTVLLTGCGGGSKKAAAVPASTSPVIANFNFEPNTSRVKAGATVTWTNQDPTAHSVVADDGSFKSQSRIDSKATFAHTFATPGTYHYHCGIHTYMQGTIIVS